MVAIVAAGHPLAGKGRPGWADLARNPLVLPPPWASLRVKIEQAFFRHGFEPPVDLMESSSYLAVTTFVAQRQAVGFVARTVGRQLEAEGRFRVLAMPVEVDLPPVGLITLRDRRIAPGATQLMACLRAEAGEIDGGQPDVRRNGRRNARRNAKPHTAAKT